MREKDFNKELSVYHLDKSAPGHVCNLCECPEGFHVAFWKCPLFENDLICSDCCQVECMKEDIDEKFSEKLGRKITKDEINDACFECGKNNAFQDEDLALETEYGDKSKDVNYEEKNQQKGHSLDPKIKAKIDRLRRETDKPS